MGFRLSLLICLGLLAFSSPAPAQESDGPLQDPFLDDLTGTWVMTGHVMGDSVTYEADGRWALNHQFLRLRMKDVNSPPEYVAQVYIGYDRKTQEYVAHWLDSSGGRPSKTLGYGRQGDDALELRFEYPDGPFRTTFERKTERRWRVLMRTKGDDGRWDMFAEYDMVREENP